MAKPTKPKDLKPKAEGEAGAAPAAGASGGGGSALDIKFIILLVVMVLSSILGSAGSVYLMTSMLVTPEIQKIAKATGGGEAKEGEEAKEGGEESTHEVGMNLELDEFMINLKSDPALGGNQYLKAKMALSIKPPEKENCYAHKEKASVDPAGRPKGRPGINKRGELDPTIAMTPVIPILPGVPSTEAAKGRLLGGRVAGAAMPIDLSTQRSQSVGHRIDFDPTLLANEGEGGPPPCETEFKAAMGKFVPTIRDVINASLMKRTASQLASAEGQETLKDEIKEQLTQIMAPEYSVLRVNFQDFIIQK